MIVSEIQRLSINLKNPDLDFKDIDFNKFTIFIGDNGSGKSFVMKSYFASNLILKGITTMGLKKQEIINHYADFVFKNTFSDFEATGTIKFKYQVDVEIEFTFSEGSVKDVKVTNVDKIEEVISVRFMSSDMRTFDSIEKYLALRNLIKISKEDHIEDMLKSYRLYDVIYCDSLMHAVERGIKIPSEIGNKLIDYDFPKKPSELIYNNGFYIVYEDETKQKVTSMSKGTQSILNMFIGTMI